MDRCISFTYPSRDERGNRIMRRHSVIVHGLDVKEPAPLKLDASPEEQAAFDEAAEAFGVAEAEFRARLHQATQEAEEMRRHKGGTALTDVEHDGDKVKLDHKPARVYEKPSAEAMEGWRTHYRRQFMTKAEWDEHLRDIRRVSELPDPKAPRAQVAVAAAATKPPPAPAA